MRVPVVIIQTPMGERGGGKEAKTVLDFSWRRGLVEEGQQA